MKPKAPRTKYQEPKNKSQKSKPGSQNLKSQLQEPKPAWAGFGSCYLLFGIFNIT
jgi:hypothetical protein